MGNLLDLFKGWSCIDQINLEGRPAKYESWENLPISQGSRKVLSQINPEGLYLHQYHALKNVLKKKNVCMTTSTASGKSLVFYISAIEILKQDPTAKILAMYPLKALGREQEDRWKTTLAQAGLDARVGRIDGSIYSTLRSQIIQDSNILIMTPDVVHAWLLSNLSNNKILTFLQSLRMVIIDEVHTYNGVFGSNAAFLIRRLQSTTKLLDIQLQFICASATIAKSEEHLEKLVGEPFTHIGADLDTSPKYPVEIFLLNPPGNSDILSEIATLLNNLVTLDHFRFICFVDSRKQTEHIASILARQDHQEDDSQDIKDKFDHLQNLDVLPYRAGYEEADRRTIQQRLSNGSLKGVVSTSALELGLDIPDLNAAVLVGVPRSSTSLHQRIGRIGRHGPGTVFIINTGDVFDETVFLKPKEFMNRPMAECALYLENQRIQYIHVLCLGRHNGELEQICQHVNIQADDDTLKDLLEWPKGFGELIQKERIGEIPVDLQAMKEEAGEDPNHYYPLRDVGVQYKVEFHHMGTVESLGTLSNSQLMREAYPGAVYYYTTKPYRVYQIFHNTKAIRVRKENHYSTKPLALPTLVFPNLTEGNVFQSYRLDECCVLESNLQIRESVIGFEERRGPNKFVQSYPVDHSETGIRFDMPRFARNFFTTGIILFHPCLMNTGVEVEKIASIIFEAFLMHIPFERRDLNYSCDKFRKTRGLAEKDQRFIAVYDQTYGSLRLSSRLLEAGTLKKVLEITLEMIKTDAAPELSEASLEALNSLYECSQMTQISFDCHVEEISEADGDTNLVKVILPGSKGLDIKKDNEEFSVEEIFYTPRGLRYRGKHLSDTRGGAIISIPCDSLVEIPGESLMGYYNLDAGEVVENVDVMSF